MLPKTVSPRLLDETIEKIGVRSTANGQAGFKVCNIVPSNPDAVLKKMIRMRPQVEQQNDESAMERRRSDTILAYLSEMRTGGLKPQTKREEN